MLPGRTRKVATGRRADRPAESFRREARPPEGQAEAESPRNAGEYVIAVGRAQGSGRSYAKVSIACVANAILSLYGEQSFAFDREIQGIGGIDQVALAQIGPVRLDDGQG